MKTKATYLIINVSRQVLLLLGALISSLLVSHGKAIFNEEEQANEARLTSSAFEEDPLSQEGLTEGWFGQETWLATRGLYPFATFTGDFLSNTNGGWDEDSSWNGLFNFGFEANLEKLLGVEGGVFFFNAFYFHGNDPSGSYVGDFNGVSNSYTNTDFNVFNLFYQQHFSEVAWGKLGQIALDDDFMVSETALLFVNSVFGPLPIESGNLAAPIYPLAAPGALIYWEPIENWFFQTAVYAGDAGPEQSNNHGFKWRAGGNAGYAWFGELGHTYDFIGSGTIKIGGYYATGRYFTDFSTGTNVRGFGSLYALLDHQLIDEETSNFGLSFFLRGGLAPKEKTATVYAYVDGGFVIDCLFLEEDALGFAFAHTAFGDEYVQSERLAGTPVTSSETVLELTYQFKPVEWLAIQPDFQYILDPHFSTNDAFTTGIRAGLLF